MTTAIEIPALEEMAFDRSVPGGEAPVVVLFGDG